MSPPEKPFQESANGPKSQGQLRKNVVEKRVISDGMTCNLTKKAQLDNDEEEYDGV